MLEEINLLYAVVVGASTSVGAVVGFGVSLRSLRKSQLEIEELKRKANRAEQEQEKLRLELEDLRHKGELTRLSKEKAKLEIDKLSREATPKGLLVTELTTQEIVTYGQVSPSKASETAPKSGNRITAWRVVTQVVVIVGVFAVAAHFWDTAAVVKMISAIKTP